MTSQPPAPTPVVSIAPSVDARVIPTNPSAALAAKTDDAATQDNPTQTLSLKSVTPSVPEMIVRGRNIMRELKSKIPRTTRPLPKPAKPRGPKVTNVKLSRRAMLAHARCLRRNNPMMTEHLERLSRPLRRRVVYLWREHGHVLPPEAIARFRRMCDADEPFMPEQAYHYFVTLRHNNYQKKKNMKSCAKDIKKGMTAIGMDRRYEWARHATVKFARGIQNRLARPGEYKLTGRMERMSKIILRGLCKSMNEALPRGRCQCRPKSKLLMEMADKIAIWIDEILLESDIRMLMMDNDEDNDVIETLKREKADVKTSERQLNMVEERLVEKGLELAVDAKFN